MKDVLQRAIDTWGTQEQWRMLQEECGELIAAINRKARGRPGSDENLLEEVVDVWILIQQARYMLADETRFCTLMDVKLDRLKERLDVEQWRRKQGLSPLKDVGLQFDPKPQPPEEG